MIAKAEITITINGEHHKIGAGRTIPAPVIAFWRATGELERLQTSGAVAEEKAQTVTEEASEAPAQRKRGDR